MIKKLFKPRYVPYDPKYIQLSSQDERVIEQIADNIREFVKSSDKVSGVSYHTRDAHAKGYCALKAKFKILDNLPKEYAQGLYANTGIHDAVIRFSNGAHKVAEDNKLGLVQGLAIKIFDVPGKKIAPGEEDSPTFDYNLVNCPVFFCNTAKDYMIITTLVLKGSAYLERSLSAKAKFAIDCLTHARSMLPTKESIKTFKAIRRFASIEPKNTWLYDFHSQGAVRHGNYMAKIRVTPTQASQDKITRHELDLAKQPNAIQALIIDEIREHDYEFDVQIQLCRHLKKQPIEDLTKEWLASDAPFVTVAKLIVPCQDVPDDGNFEVMENLSFTPFRSLEANRPIGNLQQSRLRAYQASSQMRHELNEIKRQEPNSLKEAFATAKAL